MRVVGAAARGHDVNSLSRGLPLKTFARSSTAASCSAVSAVGQVEHEAVVDVAAAGLAEALGTQAAQALDRARARARRHAQRLAAVERRDLDVRAAQRLGDRQRHLDLDVVALAREDRRVLARA